MVNIHFLPEEIAVAKVIEQIQASASAYPLFSIARMFLQRPERHHVRFTPVEGQTLYKIKDTTILSTDRSRLEATAFQATRDQWFRIEVTELDEIKGNFSNVARSALTGKIFGPTSHHTFQPAIRREYEERFSRRMSFPEYRSKIEVSNEPAMIEQWKQESRRVEKFVTTQAETEQTFATQLEAELYFKKEILPSLIVETPSETLAGPDARDLQDQRLGNAIRGAWDRETKFPLGLVNELRNHLNNSGLHIFKFKKRILLVSTTRPVWLDDKTQTISSSIQSVLAAIREKPGIARKELAERVVGVITPGDEENALVRKNTLISDLHWLVRQGHVIEFADGTYDLPLSPRQKEAAEEPTEPAPAAVESSPIIVESNPVENFETIPEPVISQAEDNVLLVENPTDEVQTETQIQQAEQ